MGSLCCVISSDYRDQPVKAAICLKTDDISISPRLFIKENSNFFLSVYQISDYPVGLGSIGEVWVCTHLRSKEKRAVKIISKKSLREKDIQKKTVLKEVEILKHLDHPCILKIFEYFEDVNCYYIVMEYCKGGDLFDKLEEIQKFCEKDAATIMQQVFSVLCYMHSKNIVHRDIKLENILIVNEKNLMIKVIDFNISIEKTKKRLKKMTGTPSYMAPEVIRGNYTEKCDLWSSGVVLNLLVTGIFPFDAEFHDQLLRKILCDPFCLSPSASISFELKHLLHQLFVKDPFRRISAESALGHAWIKQNCNSNVLEKDMTKTLRRLKTMPKVTKVQEMFQTFIVAQITKHDEEIIKLKKLFESLDKDKNGVISKEELIQSLFNEMGLEAAEVKAQEIIEVTDNDHSGRIDFSEFLRVMIKEKTLLSEENLKKAFFYFDQDRSERIEKEELMGWLSEDMIIPSEIAEELMSQADCNGDGVIDLEEFQSVLLKTLEIIPSN